jgi:hypothetical protein
MNFENKELNDKDGPLKPEDQSAEARVHVQIEMLISDSHFRL